MLVFIVFIVSIGSVCAADSSDFSDAISANIDTENSCAIDNVDVLDENNLGLCESQAIAEASDDEQASSDAIGSDDYSDKLSDGDSGTFTDLKNLISSTSENVIELDKDYIFSEGDSFLSIGKTLTINGNGHTINGNNQSYMQISAKNFILNDLNIVNCTHNYGGALVWSGSNGVMNNCTVSDSSATYAGAVRWSGSNGLIANCTFNGNVADKEGTASMGGAIQTYSGTNITIFNCTFNDNYANQFGGAILVAAKKTTIANCTFNNNKVGEGEGGAIAINQVDCIFENNTFNKNSATRGGAIAIYKDNVVIKDSTFKENFAEAAGAILIDGSNALIDNDVFIDNAATRYNGGAISAISGIYQGGWKYTANNVTVNNSKFDGNTAKNYGGALSLNAPNIMASTFTNNKANGSFGGALYTVNGKISDSTFSGNTANVEGNDVYALNTLALEGTEIPDENKEVKSLGNLLKFDRYYDSNEEIAYIETEDGYTGLCIEKGFLESLRGVENNDMSIVRNSISGEDVSDYLKILVFKYYPENAAYRLRSFVWKFTDEDFRSSTSTTVKAVVDLYDAGFRVKDNGTCRQLENGTFIYYEFSTMVTPSAVQNFILFKVTYKDYNESVSKECLNKTPYVGDIVEFRVNVTNTGETIINNAFISDKNYSDNLEYHDWKADVGNWKYDDDSNTWVLLDPLEQDQTASIILFFKVLNNGTLENNVSAGVDGIVLANNTTNLTAYAPNLTVEKISNNKTVKVGEKISFTILLTNTGDCNLTGVYVKDNSYSDGLKYDSFIDESGKWTFDGVDTWTYNGELAPGETASFDIVFEALTAGVKVNTAIAGSDITNETNSTNQTEVNETPEDDIPENETPEDETPEKDTPKKIANISKNVGVANATGNPLFALVAVLVILFGMPLRRRK